MVDPVILAFGDIAAGYQDRVSAVAALALSLDPDVILVTGDTSNGNGTAESYADEVAPGLAGIKHLIRPTPGNHDYGNGTRTPWSADAYWAYYGSAVGVAEKNWYSFDLPNDWHIICLNSIDNAGVGINAASEQGLWLAADLAANAGKHILAYWHYPASGSGEVSGQKGRTWKSEGSFWHQLYLAGAEIIVNGHDHAYERMHPMDWEGNLDYANGIRQFIVGTGGSVGLGTDAGGVVTNSAVLQNIDSPTGSPYGVLKLTLGATLYEWEFVSASGYSTFAERGARLLRGETYPGGWINAANASIYLSGADLTEAGHAYVGMRAAHAIRPPATGLVGSF